jgi:hypothetical protein
LVRDAVKLRFPTFVLDASHCSDARDIAKTEQYAVSMRLRKKVEMLFAHLKRILRPERRK